MTERTYGARYDKNADVKDIAKTLRREIAEEIEAGVLPRGKYSVKIARFSGGQSIDIRVADLELTLGGLFRDEYLQDTNVYQYMYQQWVYDTLEIVGALMSAHNHDGSDSQSDYFDVKFYGNATVDGRWHNERYDLERTAYLARSDVPAAESTPRVKRWR